MKCTEARKMIPLYAGDDLEPHETSQLEEHLATCEKCRALLDACSKDRELLASLREKGPQPPDFTEFWAGLKEKLRPETRRRRAHLILHRVLRAVTAAAVLLIVVTFLWHLGPETQIPQRPISVDRVESVGSSYEEAKLETEEQGLEMEECELCIDTNRKFDF
jgi:predicted anti-sigma-YlaC factor YlaD